MEKPYPLSILANRVLEKSRVLKKFRVRVRGLGLGLG